MLNRGFFCAIIFVGNLNVIFAFINSEKNTNKNLILMERAGIDFRSDYLDIGINGNIDFKYQ